MPKAAYLEMVADWMGASRAYEGRWPIPGEWEWLSKNWGKIQLHAATQHSVRRILLSTGHDPHRHAEGNHD